VRTIAEYHQEYSDEQFRKFCALILAFHQANPQATTVPQKHRTESGYCLGTRLDRERQCARSKSYPIERRWMMDAIWPGILKHRNEAMFDELCVEVEAYRRAHPKETEVSRSYVTESGYPLGARIASQRKLARSPGYSRAHRRRINAIWPGLLDPVLSARIKKFCTELKKYRQQNPDATTVTCKYVTPDPDRYRLGAKLSSERQRAQDATYPSEHRAAIEASWPGILENVRDAPFKKFCLRLKAFCDANPTARTVPIHHVESDGYHLRMKFKYVLDRIRSGKYPPERRSTVEAIWPEAFTRGPNEIEARLNTFKGAADEFAALLFDTPERRWHVTQPNSVRTYTLRLVPFGLREGSRFKHRGTEWRLVVHDRSRFPDDSQHQTFVVLGPDTMGLGKVDMPLITEVTPGAREAFVAAEFAGHVRFWDDFRAALESKQFLEMPAVARHPFETLLQRATQGIAVASHTRASDVAVINNGSAQQLLNGNGVSNGASRPEVAAEGTSPVAKRRPPVKQLVLS
jgi:hypothetical protein